MVIIDTSVWIDYFNDVQTPQTDWLDAHIEQERLGLTDLNLCELLQGVHSEQDALEMTRELRRFEIYPTGGIDLAIDAAQHYRTLRAKGITIRKTIDCLIASFCLVNEYQLLHNDRDFDPFEALLGLRAVHP